MSINYSKKELSLSRALPLAAFFFILTFMGIKLVFAVDSKNLVGKAVPRFNVSQLDDNTTFSSAEFKGHYSLINFFASWCFYCAAEHETLKKLSDEQDIKLYGMNWKDTKGKAKEYLTKHGNIYEKVGFDPSGSAGVGFGIEGTPESFLINPEGKIIYSIKGPIDAEIIEKEILPRIR